MSSRPNSFLTLAMVSRTWSRLVTSILMASDLRPIARISSAVAFDFTQPAPIAAWARKLPDSSAVFWRSGSSSTRMSVITTSAPSRASVSASSRPSPRDAPVMTATLPERSNGMRCLLSWKWKPGARLGGGDLGQALGQDPLPLLVLGFELELQQPLPLAGDAAAEGDQVAGQHHRAEAAAEQPQPPVVARPTNHEVGQLRHAEHAVGDDSRQAGGTGGGFVEVDRVAVPRGVRVCRDLLPGHLPGVLMQLFQPRITLTIRERQSGPSRVSTSVT